MIDFVSLGSTILNGFLDLVMNFINSVLSVILLPIDAVLSAAVPSYSDFLQYIIDALNIASQYVGYCLDSIGLYSSTIYLFVAYLSAKLTVPIACYMFKLAVRWYNAIKL